MWSWIRSSYSGGDLDVAGAAIATAFSNLASVIFFFDVFDFKLDREDMAKIGAMDTGMSCFFDHRDPVVVENLAGLVRNV